MKPKRNLGFGSDTKKTNLLRMLEILPRFLCFSLVWILEEIWIRFGIRFVLIGSWWLLSKEILILGSGGGSVGRAVASNIRDSRFESQQQQSFIYQF